jgi:hypothetical protein
MVWWHFRHCLRSPLLAIFHTAATTFTSFLREERWLASTDMYESLAQEQGAGPSTGSQDRLRFLGDFPNSEACPAEALAIESKVTKVAQNRRNKRRPRVIGWIVSRLPARTFAANPLELLIVGEVLRPKYRQSFSDEIKSNIANSALANRSGKVVALRRLQWRCLPEKPTGQRFERS